MDKHQQKKLRRKQRRDRLEKISQERIKNRPTPNHGVSEAKLLQALMTVEELKAQGNGIVKKLEDMDRQQIVDKALESHYMMQVLMRIVIDAGLATVETIQRLSEQIQSEDLGLIDQVDGVVKDGSIAMIKFKIFDGDKLIEDKTSAPMAYLVGSKAMPIDGALMGMTVGSEKKIEINFGNIPTPDLANKQLEMELAVVAIKVREVKATAATKG